ncbi:MAG: hypothetical protein GXO11_03925 [Epsilonproteobacteria bacterium]|nr:hypothetical protein [Campylobacterota bacterium]
MKITRMILSLAVVGIWSSVFADIDIDQQIQQIQNASAQERVELMNQLKQRIMQMNEEQRYKAMVKLQSSMNSAKNNLADNVNKATDQVVAQQSMVREHIDTMQMTATTQIQQSQQMNHQRVSDQYNNMQQHQNNMLGQSTNSQQNQQTQHQTQQVPQQDQQTQHQTQQVPQQDQQTQYQVQPVDQSQVQQFHR